MARRERLGAFAEELVLRALWHPGPAVAGRMSWKRPGRRPGPEKHSAQGAPAIVGVGQGGGPVGRLGMRAVTADFDLFADGEAAVEGAHGLHFAAVAAHLIGAIAAAGG
ncbi:hypothetical protein GCM10027514_07640 [Azotobacter armeniacus]